MTESEWEGELNQKDSDTVIIEQLHLEQWQSVSYLGPERPEQEFKAHDYGYPLHMVRFRIRKLIKDKSFRKSFKLPIISDKYVVIHLWVCAIGALIIYIWNHL